MFMSNFEKLTIVAFILWSLFVRHGREAECSMILVDAKDENVDFKQQQDETYILAINENIPEASLFIVEKVQGTTPLIEFLNEKEKCAAFETGYEFQRIDSETYKLFLKTSLDYEQKNCHNVKANVRDKSGGFVTFNLEIRNLDDNEPQFSLSSKCEMKENTDYPKSSKPCLITLTDADGMLENTALTVVVTSSYDPDVTETFEIEFVETPNDSDTHSDLVIFLREGKQLDFETINLHSFKLRAQQEISVVEVQFVVNVIDMPDQPPKWTKMFTIKQFQENVDQILQVEAVDGDVQVNTKINYSITENDCSEMTCDIQIDEDSGTITVKNVDREQTGDTIELTINAFEIDGSNETSLKVTFFIEDQDDNEPEIHLHDTQIEIAENFVGSITTFSVEDMDLGDSGTYDIKLVQAKNEIDYTIAFSVIPTSGYQKSNFTLTVTDSSKLDYEDEHWKTITFEIQAIEKANESFIDSRTIVINLSDVNDESPIFVSDIDSVEIKESIGGGVEIFSAEAEDADAGDEISYEIIGVWNSSLNIDNNGMISPKRDGIFDYEQLQQVVLQIKASDKVNHETYKSLTINVVDVDDTPPSIKVGNSRMTIKENSHNHTKIENSSITVSDPDTNPKLSIEINWEKSFITKNSAIVNSDGANWQCFEIFTDSILEENDQKINSYLRINDECSPDFELFDAITIHLIATDSNTEIGDESSDGSIFVNIEDVNDNAPVFDLSSLNDLEVKDGDSGSGVKIGVISATDVDLNEKISFSIRPLCDGADWIDIDEKTGKLKLKDGITIDDDNPRRDVIRFEITASDKDNTHQQSVNVNISINDVNDETPSITNKIDQFSIKEQTEELHNFISLKYKDLDRDEPFHTVNFKFDTNITNEATMRFNISEKGEISVDLQNGATLDRDHGDKEFILPILAYDNPSGTTQLEDHLDITIVLEDINNNSPEIEEKKLECSENNGKGDTLGPIHTNDPDDGDNSKVKFEITDVEPFSEENLNVLTTSSFSISTNDNKTAIITILQDLKGFYGTYNITVKTTDYGDPPMSQNNQINLTVYKFNFENPTFVFPSADSQEIVLSKDQIPSSDSPLKLYNGSNLNDLEVDDLQNHKWEINFEIIDENGKSSPTLFTIKNFKSYKARLQLLKNPSGDDEKYDITIQASLVDVHEPSRKSSTTQTHMKISFFDPTEPPKFSVKTATISFEENSRGTSQPIPKATFGADIDVKPVYMLLDNTDIFEIDSHEGNVSLKQELDYEKVQKYEISIIASSTNVPPADIPDDSILKVDVEVVDINEFTPSFNQDKFVGAFLKNYNKQSTIITISATDEDLSDQKNGLHFSIDGEITCYGFEPPQTPAFSIGPSDGKVSPNFIMSTGKSGHCNFKVSVSDNPDKHETVHSNYSSVQINFISDDELVRFIFFNTDDDVVNKEEEITDKINEIFEDFNYESHLADYNYDEETSNTTANFFFLDVETQNPVKADEIKGNLTDYTKFTTLKKSLASIHIYLDSFPSDNVINNTEDQLKKWLFVAIFILMVLIVLLSILFFYRNRILSRRIKNLSTTKFGSKDSGINRIGLTLPTTNKNAVEGSNPVFNFDNQGCGETDDIDVNSIISGDSDLIGVENNPEFDL